MQMIWAVLTIAVTLLGVAVVVLTAAEPLVVAVAERRGPRQAPHRVRAHPGTRS